MESLLQKIFAQIAAYAAVLIIGYVGINFLSGGFLSKFLKVKMSRGRLTLVKIVGVSRSYFRTGLITENWLIFSDSEKQKRRLNVPGAYAIEYVMGVRAIAIDDEKNAIILPSGEMVEGFDAVKAENLHVRALTSPREQDKMLKIILFLLIANILATIIVGVLVYKLGGRVDALGTVAATITEVI